GSASGRCTWGPWGRPAGRSAGESGRARRRRDGAARRCGAVRNASARGRGAVARGDFGRRGNVSLRRPFRRRGGSSTRPAERAARALRIVAELGRGRGGLAFSARDPVATRGRDSEARSERGRRGPTASWRGNIGGRDSEARSERGWGAGGRTRRGGQGRAADGGPEPVCAGRRACAASGSVQRRGRPPAWRSRVAVGGRVAPRGLGRS